MNDPAKIINDALLNIDSMPPVQRRIVLDAVNNCVQQLRSGKPIDASQMVDIVTTQAITIIKMFSSIVGANDKQRRDALLSIGHVIQDELNN